MGAAAWQTLGGVPPRALVDARLQLHHAAQWVAAAGASLLEAVPDDSHPNFGWEAGRAALMGREIPGPAPFRVGLSFADRALLVLGVEGDVRDAFALDGRTLADVSAWFEDAVLGTGAALPEGGISPPGYALPAHPIAQGAAFTADAAACAELARWFSDADAVLGDLVPRLEGAGEARIWPHHFDLGTLAALERAADGSLRKSIGVGLSPGDDSVPEPYWYVSPWPYPDPAELPGLADGGVWHHQGYVAAVLTGSRLVDGAATSQPKRLEDFLAEAILACEDALRR